MVHWVVSEKEIVDRIKRLANKKDDSTATASSILDNVEKLKKDFASMNGSQLARVINLVNECLDARKAGSTFVLLTEKEVAERSK